MTGPVVSIVLLTYEFEQFLERSIESALAQDYPRELLDIIVIDDGSTDSTPAITARYEDRVKVIRKPNGGLISSVNRGFAEARGDYVCLLSGDDEYLPFKTRVQVDLLESRPEVGLVYGDLEVVDPDSNVSQPSLWRAVGVTPARGRVLGKLLARNFVSGGTLMLRREILDRLLPIPANAGWEDWYLAAGAAAEAELEYLDRPLYRYRYHGNNMNLGASGEKVIGLLRTELPFRRWLLTGVDPASATPKELMSAWEAFTATAAHIARADGSTFDEVLEIGDDQQSASRSWDERGDAALEAGDARTALFAFVSAMAQDPFDDSLKPKTEEALRQLGITVETAETGAAKAVADARGVRVLAFAEELIATPDLLVTYAKNVGTDADATLVISGRAEDFAALGMVIESAGLDDDSSPDMLVVPTEQHPSAALIPFVRAVYSREHQHGHFAELPRLDDSSAQELAELN